MTDRSGVREMSARETGAVELKPCPSPWCEAKERAGDYSPQVRLHHHGNYRVVCTSCCLEGPLEPTQNEAITAWNSRPQPTPAGEIVERVFSEPVVDQSKRLKVFPADAESPQHWIERVRKAALNEAIEQQAATIAELRGGLTLAAAKLAEIGQWRKDCHSYDADAGHEPRDFDDDAKAARQ